MATVAQHIKALFRRSQPAGNASVRRNNDDGRQPRYVPMDEWKSTLEQSLDDNREILDTLKNA